MGTRATYEVDGKVFYIHWDGYPEGAAEYFHNMIDNYCEIIDDIGRTRNGGYAEAFLRGNELAEFTSGHNAHGDTEWQYTLEGNELSVVELSWDRDSSGKRLIKNSYTVNLFDFINKHIPDNDLVLWEREGFNGPVTSIITKKSVSQKLIQKEKLKQTWIDNGNMNGANGKYLQKEINKLEKMLKS